MRRKADADNSRIGGVRSLPTFIVRFFRLFLRFCRKHGRGFGGICGPVEFRQSFAFRPLSWKVYSIKYIKTIREPL